MVTDLVRNLPDAADLPTLDELKEVGLSDRDIAFRVWVLVCDRNASKTSRYLKDVYDLDISRGTISVWKGRYNWDELAGELFADAAPAKLQRMAVRVLSASESALNYLHDVAVGIAPTNDKGEIDKGRASVCLELVRMVGFVAPKPNDVSVSGTSFQRSIGHAPGSASDAIVSAPIEEIEAALRERGITIH